MEKLNDKIISFLRFFWKFGYEPTEIKNSKYLPTPKILGIMKLILLQRNKGSFVLV
jgi:hypothetical protein